LDEWRRAAERSVESDSSDLARLVAAVDAAARERGSTPARSPWPPPLPLMLTRAELDPPARPRSVVLGLVDLPDEQRQGSFEFGITPPDSLLVAGAARSGRTNALVSLALGAGRTFSPAELHLQVIDAGGDLARTVRLLPHCATVLGPAEVHLAPTLLARLERAAAARLASAATTSESAATVLVLIDGWDVACAALGDADAAVGTDALITLLRVAPAVGLAIAVTGDRGVLAPRFAGGFAERLLLRLSDRHDAGAVGLRPPDVPRVLPSGRAVRAPDGTLVQLALPAASADALHADIAATALRWMPEAPGPFAIRVRPLPDQVRLGELPAPPGLLALGLAGDDPAPVFADPFAGPARWLVAGPPRSGRTTLLRLLAEQAHTAGMATLVAATERSALLVAARDRGIPTVGPGNGVGPPPTRPTLVLVDDSEAFTDTAAGAQLAEWARNRELPLALVAAGRADDLATSYRGVAAEVRRHRFGVLLRPSPLDGELFGLRLPRHGSAGPPGRGVALADPSWGALFADGGPVPIQVATP
jgi:S-DNA-T family DNA segregation ATPase FtsK/SpoIIIE